MRDLKKHLSRQKAVLIWDGLPAHESREMKKLLESQRSWSQVDMLPRYSPDLNPVEDLWGKVEGQVLADRSVDGVADAEVVMTNGMERIRQSDLPFSFLRHAGLSF
ncbi:MAG: transposase [Acidobacteria bacterium]|nr:transposase [Acidobacteriota bacterium]